MKTARVAYAILLTLAGCVTSSSEIIWDKGIPIQINRNTDCPDGSRNACAVGQGIYLPVWAWKDTELHEIGHVHGMVHGPWVLQPDGRTCTTVTVQGGSDFPVGYKFCHDPAPRGFI